MKRFWSLLLALIMILSLSACAGEGKEVTETTESGSAEEFEPAPDFTVYDKDGNTIKLSDMTGTPVVLNFWASWCSPCKAEMPEFDEIAKEYAGKVAFMMVDLTDGVQETQEKAQAFIDSMGYTFPVYFDKDSDAAYKYGIQSIPTTIFIDANGNLIAGATGAIDGETLRYGISMIYTETE